MSRLSTGPWPDTVRAHHPLGAIGTRSAGAVGSVTEATLGYSDSWAMWNSIGRGLEGVLSVAKGGHGEWAYAGDTTLDGE